MLFTSVIFVFVFFPLSLILYGLLQGSFQKNVLLVCFSILFYAWGEPKYIILLIVSILVNYWIAICIDTHKNSGKRAGIYVFISFIYNLGILWVFKYLDFTIQGMNHVFGTNLSVFSLALPVGISFFTFKSISYCMDVYYQTVKAEKNILNVALYIAFFPQITNGPIQTYHSFCRNLRDRNNSFEMVVKGVRRVILGMGKKMIIADHIAVMVAEIFSRDAGTVSVLLAWLGAVGWMIQLYFDFSGYSDIAIGVGFAFGFECEENFNYPYISQSVAEYWGRWHISLGNWFNKYFYTPLFRTLLEKKNPFTKRKFGVLEGDVIALLVVWMFTGLWHGANLTYVIWGIYNGIFIIIARFIRRYEKQRRKRKKQKRNEKKLWIKIIKIVRTFVIVTIGLVIFRSDTIHSAFEYIFSMFGLGNGKWIGNDVFYYLRTNWLYLFLGVLFCFPTAPLLRSYAEKNEKAKQVEMFFIPAGYILLFFICISCLMTNTSQTFLYFKF